VSKRVSECVEYAREHTHGWLALMSKLAGKNKVLGLLLTAYCLPIGLPCHVMSCQRSVVCTTTAGFRRVSIDATTSRLKVDP